VQQDNINRLMAHQLVSNVLKVIIVHMQRLFLYFALQDRIVKQALVHLPSVQMELGLAYQRPQV